jgi:hypothetical protein
MVEAGEKSGFLMTTCGKAADMIREAGFIGQSPNSIPIAHQYMAERS